jgi:hypothetical protein
VTAVLCVIILHGDQTAKKESVIKGTDRKQKILKELIDPFKSNQSLEGKPKIFLINACRGKKTFQTFQTCSIMPNQFLDVMPQVYGNSSSRKVDPHKTIREADIFFHYSTVLGYVSFGNSAGSWFIKAWSTMIEGNSHLDIHDQAVLVNQRTSQNSARIEKD